MVSNKVKQAFKAVKKDINELKASATDWILFLNRDQRDMKVKLRELDQRLRELEHKRELEVFR